MKTSMSKRVNSESLKITSRIEDSFYIISLNGTLDESGCGELRNALDAGARSHCEHVLLDLKDLVNINTTAQRIILSYLSRLQHLEMLLILCQVNLFVQKALMDSGLDKHILVAPTLAEAKFLATAYK